MVGIRQKITDCKVLVGMDRYKNYQWATTLAFMDFK